ncbi:hypothetical protein JHK85_056277 [Glycine max]|nr:hypothetical protein JHK86_055286 [Glycine max]KAG4917996.1 hypothetical protein JHK85_056277 [Glycine max]
MEQFILTAMASSQFRRFSASVNMQSQVGIPMICRLRLPAMVVTQVQLDRAKVSTKSAVLMNLESRDIRRELEMEIIEEHTVMEYSKVSKKCEKCGHGEATYYTRQMRSTDKGQTTFYACTGCGHPSQEN